MKHREDKSAMTPQEAEKRKQEKRETRSQTMFALRCVLSAYLVYLGYDLISKTIKDEEGGSFWYIIVGVVFAVVGVYVLIDCWKRKRQHDAEEREAQRQELQAKGLLDFDEPANEADTEPADDDFWTEDSDAEATPEGDASRDETAA